MKIVEQNWFLREIKYIIIGPLHRLTVPRSALETAERDIRLVRSCPDYKRIPRVGDAGKIKNGKLIMHNGVKILPGSYYGYGNLKFLQATGGIHEPQEEYVFSKVLEIMPPGAVMLELGAYWSFYSLWFSQAVKSPKCYLVEPILSNLNYGKKNFALNEAKANFTQAYIGKSSVLVNDIWQISVDDFLKEHKIPHLNILHADIQGQELEMLKGATHHIAQRKIDYMFISTHSNQLHKDCQDFLIRNRYSVIASANLDASYSPDGVIVARRDELNGIDKVKISMRSDNLC
ncbi:MAG: FkbM family methyltransferase [Anaerolineae bacterium]|nr:FkbM family methyltransferase [Anaerolineae bacterium]